MAVYTLYPCQNGWCFIPLKVVLLPIPSLEEPQKGCLCGMPGTGHSSDFSATLNLLFSLTISDGLSAKSRDVYMNVCATYLFLDSPQHSCQYEINA